MTRERAQVKVAASGGTLEIVKDIRVAGGFGTRSIAVRRAACRRYDASVRGQEMRWRWKTAHPWRRLLYDARYAVKQSRARLQMMTLEEVSA